MWRKLFILTSFVLAFAFSTMAMASDIAFYVGQFNTDGWYGEEQFTDVETIIAETGHLFNDIQQFNDDDLTFAAFNAWVDKRTNDGIMDIIWLNGCTPSCLYPNPNEQPDGSRIEAWLDGGNMVINVGDWFAYCTYEGGPRGGEGRGGDNGGDGAANILDLSSGIIFGADGTQLTVTPAGKQYLPSLNDPAKTDRPVSMAAVEAPWEVAAIFASPGGTDDPAAEAHADPVVIHNTETGGYVAFINQASGGPDGWTADRGLTCAEFIGNWVTNVVGLVDMEIGFAVQPPVIDGQVDGLWAAASTQSFVPLEDPADGSGTWKVLYDAENLYVLVDMTDDSLQNDSSSSWQDDSVEIYFDGGNTKLDTPLSGDDHQYTFGWTTDDIQGTNVSGYTEGIEHAQVDTGTGWRIEVKMPWLSIQGVEPQAGDLVGIDIYYNDDDDGGDSREGKMLSFSAIEGWNDASQWATAVLADAPEPVDPGTDGLVAYYALDGDPNDNSDNGNNGTISGTENWVDGKIGSTLEFDGSTTYVEIPFSESLKLLNQGDFTLSAWFLADEIPPENKEVLQQADANGTGRTWLFVHNSNEIRSYLGGGTTASGVGVEAGVWYHAAVVVTEGGDADNLQLFVNGQLSGEPTQRGMEDCEGVYIIGRHKNPTNFWDGLIDEMQLYNRALSTGEVMYLAGFRTPVDPGTENLVAYYPFDNDADDASGNNNHGTLSGDPVFIEGPAGYGMALRFDGIDDHVDCGNDLSLDITGPITIGAWVYPTGGGSSNYPRIVDKSDGTGGADPGYKMYLRVADNYLVTLSCGGVFLNSSSSANLNEWNYMVFVTDGTQRKLFLNGAWEVWEESALPLSSSNPLYVGNSPAGARHFEGIIDEVVIYNRALSESEVLFIAGEK